jgi:hypothetical protein
VVKGGGGGGPIEQRIGFAEPSRFSPLVDGAGRPPLRRRQISSTLPSREAEACLCAQDESVS